MGNPLRSRMGGAVFTVHTLKNRKSVRRGFRALFESSAVPQLCMGLPEGRPESETLAFVIPHLHRADRLHDDRTFQFRTKPHCRAASRPAEMLHVPLKRPAPRPTPCLDRSAAVTRSLTNLLTGLRLPSPMTPRIDHRPPAGPTSFWPLISAVAIAAACNPQRRRVPTYCSRALAIQAAGARHLGSASVHVGFCWFSSPALLVIDHDSATSRCFAARLNQIGGFAARMVNAIPRLAWSADMAFHHRTNGDWSVTAA